MSLNGYIMSREREIARVENGLITDFDAQRLPLYLLKTKDLTGWLESRAIDSHRTNSRLLKKALRISAADDLATVLRVHAATITDTYWFREEGSDISYDEVRFSENLFDKLALRGDPNSFNQPYSRTPELTNTGSFEKCWSRKDGHWQMLKSGNDLENFSELFVCVFGRRMGLEMASYEWDGSYVCSEDFTNGSSVNFEPVAGIMLDNEDYADNFHALWTLNKKAAEQYVGMVWLDAICFNMDRHTQNYGVLRDVETGEILSLAPLFDHNIALIARGYPKVERTNDMLIQLFVEFLNDVPEAKRIFEEFPLPELTEQLVMECIEAVPIQVDSEAVCQFILNGEQRINELLEPEQGLSQTL